MALCGTNEPPSIGDIIILVDGSPVSPSNPPKPLSVVTIDADIFNPSGTTTYTFYREGFPSNAAQSSSDPNFSIEDYNPSSGTPSNYPIPGTVLYCKITCINPIDVAEQIVEVGELHGLLPTLTGDFLSDFSLNITFNQIVNVGDVIEFTPKVRTEQAGNPDANSISLVVNNETISGSLLQYTVTGNENDCSVVVNNTEISNSDPSIQNTGTITVNYNITIAGVQGGACTDELGACCATGAYNSATGITQGSCLLFTESECLSLSPPGYWNLGNCPDCSSDLSIGNPCCPEYPRGRCCRGSDNATPCEEGVIESICLLDDSGLWDRNKTCSSCSSIDSDAGYCGCVGACCEPGFVCNDNILLHNCSGDHFVDYACSDCGTPGNSIQFDNNCCEPSGDPCENGNTVVYKTVFDNYVCRDLTIDTDNGSDNYPNDVNSYNTDIDNDWIVQDSEVFCKAPLIWNRFATGGCSANRHNCGNNNQNSCLYREFFEDGGPPRSYCNLNGICSCFVPKTTRGCVPDPPVWDPIFPGQQPPSIGPDSNDELVNRCQTKVCIIDSFCCQVEWDQDCVDIALAECTGVLNPGTYQANIFGYLYSNSDTMSCGSVSEKEPCIDTSDGYLDFRECMEKLQILSSFSVYKNDGCPGNWDGVP